MFKRLLFYCDKSQITSTCKYSACMIDIALSSCISEHSYSDVVVAGGVRLENKMQPAAREEAGRGAKGKST